MNSDKTKRIFRFLSLLLTSIYKLRALIPRHSIAPAETRLERTRASANANPIAKPS
jgi:hypothetical protein